MNKFLTFLFLGVFFVGFAQTKEDALRDAKITANATLKSDFNTVLKHTFPSIIKLMGGKEKALSFIKTTFDGMKQQGFVFEKADVIAVSEIIKEDGQYRCYVENLNQMITPQMRIKSKSFLLGVYDDEGKKWWFLEAERMKNKALLDKVLPNFKTSLNIPKDEVTTEELK